MTKAFIIDVALCNGCHNCQVVCKDEHCDQPWLPYAEAQPDTGQFWCRVDQRVRGEVPYTKMTYVPLLCSHCAETPCRSSSDGSVYIREDGLVIIDPEKARGKRELVDLCPVGAIYYNEELGLPQKCTGCAHLLDAGWSVPRCVDACPTDALKFGELDELLSEYPQAESLEELSGAGAHVYYVNYPKRFIKGTLVNLGQDEVVIGSRVELRSLDDGIIKTAVSDDFGDFSFDQIEAGQYKVTVGGQSDSSERELIADARTADVCLGVINTK